MASANLSASVRAENGKGAARSLRRTGRIPAVIYGHGREPQPLSIDTRELEKLLSHISAENTVIDLALDGASSRTIIREIQRHPFKRQILHVDFQELVAGEKIVVRIPVILMGVPDGVRMDGGILDQTMRELEVEVDPSNIPNHIEVDVTKMTIGSSLHVSDMTLPEGVEVVGDVDASVAVVSAPRAAIEETAAATEEATSAEPEVIRAKKPDEEEGEAGK
ncbi:MAG TPA: 50S ribosomal protein L25/general stress protein Ctc [Gemmatimonadaceae bacterium]|nr:50S ribosomal protein L25/general stress protein Ctc [Gemmatimonadaceae bacterium]